MKKHNLNNNFYYLCEEDDYIKKIRRSKKLKNCDHKFHEQYCVHETNVFNLSGDCKIISVGQSVNICFICLAVVDVEKKIYRSNNDTEQTINNEMNFLFFPPR